MKPSLDGKTIKLLRFDSFFPPLQHSPSKMTLPSWTKVLGHLLHFWAFSNSPRPNPSPHPTNNVGCMHPEFFLSFNFVQGGGGGGGGGGRENCKQISKRMHCFMRESRMTEKYEYCNVPRTFVHDWSSRANTT